jgi:hypothetical protein
MLKAKKELQRELEVAGQTLRLAQQQNLSQGASAGSQSYHHMGEEDVTEAKLQLMWRVHEQDVAAHQVRGSHCVSPDTLTPCRKQRPSLRALKLCCEALG